jgi:hypothetical protein
MTTITAHATFSEMPDTAAPAFRGGLKVYAGLGTPALAGRAAR